MHLSFGDKQIRQICEDQNVAIETYGSAAAQALQNRLADLWAATTLRDMIVGKPTLLHDSTYQVNLNKEYSLVFSAINRRITYESEGSEEYRYVSRIKILRIEPNQH